MHESISINIPLNEFEAIQKQWIKEVLTEESGQIGHSKKDHTELLTRKETAKVFGISLPTLNEYTKTGLIIGYRIGSRVRYKKGEILEALKQFKKYKRD